MWTEEVVGHIYNVLKGQVLSPVKVCEESEVTTNIQLYEIKQMSFTIKLYLKNVTALTNTFFKMARSSIGEDTRFSFLEEGFDSPTRYKVQPSVGAHIGGTKPQGCWVGYHLKH